MSLPGIAPLLRNLATANQQAAQVRSPATGNRANGRIWRATPSN